MRRYAEAAALLAPVGITLTVLDPAAARTVLTSQRRPPTRPWALRRRAPRRHDPNVTPGVTTSDVLPGDGAETDVLPATAVSATAVPATAVPTRRGAPVGGAVPAATTRRPSRGRRPGRTPSRPGSDPARNLVWPPAVDGSGWDGWSEPFPGSDADVLDLPTVPLDVAGATRQGWPA